MDVVAYESASVVGLALDAVFLKDWLKAALARTVLDLRACHSLLRVVDVFCLWIKEGVPTESRRERMKNISWS